MPHKPQQTEQHRPGSFAPLTLHSLYPAAKSPMPFPAHKPPLFCPLLPKLFADIIKEARKDIGTIKGAGGLTQKRGREVAFVRWSFFAS
ncbi:hypothetical protein RG47T_0324 [Mucilaginibacter polytrichastri]|uniref:Uncharacterized protein n=1 Tax=Mucilaginibacter polytrichastri TaxID=1302689 RepID=A0A1Q5ZT16_9SPHI|nr:hypothetical protein RG47T_0324 [Mucilaginibacter polytrichastri]